MRRMLLCGLLLLLLAPTARAAVSVKLMGPYNWSLGGTITLEVLVTANAGETDNTAFGAILYDSNRLTPLSSSQNALPGSGWITGQLTCTTARCVAFNQINSIAPTAINVTNFQIAVLTFQHNLTDPLLLTPLFFSWQSTPTTQRLDFFGVTSAPGVCTQLEVMDPIEGFVPCPIPEPGTAALLGLGLLGLAVACRRGRSST